MGTTAEELYDQRLSDAEIARRVGCTNTTVATWRKEKGLPRNAEPGWQKQKSPAAVPAPAPPDVYGQVETLLAALPEGCSRMARSQARDLCSVLLSEYLEGRLKLKEETA